MWFKLASATFSTHLGSMSSLSNSISIKYTANGFSYTTNSVTKTASSANLVLNLMSGWECKSTPTVNVSGAAVVNGTPTWSNNKLTIAIKPASSKSTFAAAGTIINVSVTGATSSGTTPPVNPPAGNGALGLPTDYQAVEYLETDGTQYFVFNGEKVSSNASYEIKFSAAKVNSPAALIGSYSSTAEAARSQIRLSYQKDKSGVVHEGLEWMYGAQGSVEKATVADTQIAAAYWTGTNTLKVDANKLYWNNQLLKTYNTETFTTSQTPFTLFAQNNNNAGGGGGYSRQSSIKCYFVKIKDTTNNINRELIPCYRVSDNVIGFYDTINSKFITPASGTITSKGSIITA